jgi:pimeloyl-ACP methyl ester carboxylesterase
MPTMANLVSRFAKKLAFFTKMENSTSMRCFLLPGMGADERMYDAEWDRLGDVTRINWPHDNNARSLTDLAQQIIADYGIQSRDRIIGSSLGGMVACEIANHCLDLDLILIGSATSPKEITTLLTWLHPLIDLAPLPLFQFSVGSCPLELMRMFQTSSSEFLRTMSKAVFVWKGLSTNQTQILRIHGKRDMVIPCPENADFTLEGGHLIVMSHSKECVDIILRHFMQNPQS